MIRGESQHDPVARDERHSTGLADAASEAKIWARVRQARTPLLFLDYDGTLAPFHEDRTRAVPPPATLDRLRAIAARRDDSLTIVSGRPVSELAPLLAGLEVRLVGEHGWEERSRAGVVRRHPLRAAVESALQGAIEMLEQHGLGEYVERKRTALVVHLRGLGPDLAREVREACRALLNPWPARSRLRLDQTNGGIELRAVGRDKGRCIRERLACAGDDTFAIHVGDDRTDEDAFRVLRSKGLGVRVGGEDVPTLARARLSGPGAIPAFLDAWIRATPPAATGEVTS